MALRGGALVCVWIWAMFGTVFGACASRQKPTTPVVKDLRIEGNDEISDRQIKKKILTSETAWWPFATKQHFDSVAWQTDLKRIERLYVSRGFYQAEVVKDEVVPKPGNAVELEVQVSEGKPTHIGTLKIEGLEALQSTERDAILDELPVEAGAVLREEDWEAAKKQIRAALRNHGYAKAEVDGRALVDVKSRSAALTIIARPGARYTFGDIQVQTSPNARVAPFLVWEQVRLAIPKGRTFSDRALDEAQRRVFGMGVFGTAKVSPGTPDDAQSVVPVQVDVRESAFHTLRLGGGARFDEIRNEARLVGEWTNRDFLGGMRKLTIRAEAGWAFIPNIVSVAGNDESIGARHGPIARLRFEFEQPRFLGRPLLRERSTIELDRTLEQAYNALSARVMNGVIWRPSSTVSIFPSYRVELSYLQGPPTASAAAAPLTIGCATTDDRCFVWLSYLEQVATWDRRNEPLDPRRGTYASLSLQQGGGPLGGDFTYLRVLPDARAYTSFGDDDMLTLSARLRFGQLWPWSGNPDDSAVVTRFYAGGGTSMRGFSDRRLSPLLLTPATSNPEVLITVPIGGNGMIDGSFESRLTLVGALRLALFLDFAQVTRGRMGAGDIGHALWAAGIGLRYVTPIGPIRVDFGRRLPIGRLPPLLAVDAMGAIVEIPYVANDSCFGLFAASTPTTPVTDGLCAVHFSIGEAF
jgi:translocation and assembly module TamA